MMTKSISRSLAIAAVILATAAALAFAQRLDLVAAETARRATQVMIGLILAVYGNFIPKTFGRSRASGCAVSRTQSALRVGGWSFTLAGLAQAGLWTFAPIAFANVAAMTVVATATVVTAGYGLLVCWLPRNNSSV